MADFRPRPPGGHERRRRVPNEAKAAVHPRSSRSTPILRLLGFYLILIGIAIAVGYWWPLARDSWVSALVPATGSGELLGVPQAVTDVQHKTLYDRALSTLLISVAAIAASLPVAWVYAFTRRLRYDPSLVHSIIILPLVVAGIVTVVQYNIALGFGVFGIVAAVRFRNTLKDPKDAVYIFLALGIGIAAGVGAADIALVLSLLFNLVVLVLWKYNLGSIYGGESGHDLLSVGDTTLLLARTSRQRDAIRWRMSREAAEMETDGILLVHTEDPEAARGAVELVISNEAQQWKMVDNFRNRDGVSTFAVVLQLDKKGDPLALLGELDDRYAGQVAAAEYIPFKTAVEKKKDEPDQ